MDQAKLLFASLLVLSVLVPSCKSAAQSDENAYRKSWRDDFMQGCVAASPGAVQEAFCTCVADHALKEYTTAQLGDKDFAIKHIKETLIPQCATDLKVGAPKGGPAQGASSQEAPPSGAAH